MTAPRCKGLAAAIVAPGFIAFARLVASITACSGLIAASGLVWLATGCARKTCLAGTAGCAEAPLCTALDGSSGACGATELWIGRLADVPGGVDMQDGEGAPTDIVMRNAALTVVIDAPDNPHDLAPTGGSILDMAPRGGRDGVNLVFQVAGILPDDNLAYTSLELVSESEVVAVVVRGTLFGRPEVEVVTRYELRPCDRGVRVRSELVNGTTEPLPLILGDVIHWGKRTLQPFAPLPDHGYTHPPLNLVDLDSIWQSFPYVLARAPYRDSSAYGITSCDRGALEGFNDYEISGLGTDRRIVRPGESLELQRYIVAAPGPGLAAALERILDARERLFGGGARTAITGRVIAGGVPVAGDSRRASLLIHETRASGRRPLTEIEPGEDGVFAVSVAAGGELSYELWSFGRPVARGDIGTGRMIDLGDIEIAEPARLQLSIVSSASMNGDGTPIVGVVAIHPADDETRAAVTGTWYGRFEQCAPWLGAPIGPSPACNHVLVTPPGVDVELPAGRYVAYATAGPEQTLARRELTATAGEMTELVLVLTELDIRPPGWLSADLHVHGRASFDSGLPDADRVHSFVAAGVDVIAATDHDYVSDYERAIIDSGMSDRVAVIGGLETTQLIPHLKVPGDSFPRVIGHFNFWPLTPEPALPRAGAPWDELIEPGQLFDIMRAHIGPGGIAMLNHPWDEPIAGRDLGYLRAIGFDPRVPIPADDDGTRQGMLMRRPGGGARNLDWNAIEVQNGASLIQLIKTRPLWASLLSQGFVYTGTANSDSHSLMDAQLGYGRNLVQAGSDVQEFDIDSFDQAVRDGRVIGSNGVIVLVTIGPAGGPARGLGLEPYVPSGGDTVTIEVRAPPWVPVTEVRAMSSHGARILATAADLTIPEDPLGSAGVVRWHVTLPLGELIVGQQDDWLVVEAGIPDFAAADLDDDGIVDTSDNNGDGVVDAADVEAGEDSGPLLQPPDPDDDGDPRFYMTRVVPAAWPIGFTNPILIDWAGDGWQPPGLRPGVMEDER